MNRQAFISISTIILLAIAWPLHMMGNNKTTIDFNYPQDVSKQALADLDKALASGDGQRTVDALVRYSIAQSGISQDNMADITAKLEDVIARERQPHVKALLNYFEAVVYQGYRDRYARWSDRQNPMGETPADVSEWDRRQLAQKIAELVAASLSQPDALRQVPVTALPDIIECNALGATYVPTLLEFLSMKGLELLDNSDSENITLIDRIKAQWLATTQGNAPANIFAIVTTHDGDLAAAYERYRDNEHCAYLTGQNIFNDNKRYYAELKEYLQRFPGSIYTAQVQNRIIDLEQKNAHAVYPQLLSTRDSVAVTCNISNANTCWLNVYRAPDGADDQYRIDYKKLKLVTQTPVAAQGTMPFNVEGIQTQLPPLPVGHYVIIPTFGKDEKPSQDVYSYNMLRVTDIAHFIVSHDNKRDLIAAVDITTGQPMSDVTVIKRDKPSSELGKTGKDGTMRLPDMKGARLRTVKGDDRYGPETYYHPISNRKVDEVQARFYSDLGVYRPGETILWGVIVTHFTDRDKAPVGGETFRVGFLDSNLEPIDSVTVVSDEFGRVEGSFVVPTDRMNGTFHISLVDDEDNGLGQWGVDVSEYKTPTFEITFPDERKSYVAGQPVKIAGKVMTYSGLPVAGTQVRLSLLRNEWSWWHMSDDDGMHLKDTTVVTDALGNFVIELEAGLFEESRDIAAGKRHHWARYNYQLQATVTSETGETHEQATSFIVGTRRGIELGNLCEDVYLNDRPVTLPLKYNTTDDEHPDTWCTWEVAPLGEKAPIITGTLNTATPTVDLTGLPSGQYTLRLHILDAEEGEQDVDVARDIVLYRKSDKTSPVKDCPLWVSPLGKSVDKSNMGHITVGVSTPVAYIYYVASSRLGIISEGWLTYKPGIQDFTVALHKEAGADVTVKFVSYYKTQLWEKTVKLENPFKAEELNITATSFRDKLVPGDMERWTFTLTDQNGQPRPGAMLLEMFDKAIASIAENNWQYTNYAPRAYSYYSLNAMSVVGRNGNYANWIRTRVNIPKEAIAQLPGLYTYGQTPFSFMMGRGRMMMKGNTLAMARGANEVEEVVVTDYSAALEGRSAGVMAVAESDAVKFEDAATVDEQALDNVQVRMSDVKTALWQPMLSSDDKGMITLAFEAPNFNTTWIAQAVAWDKNMVGSSWMAQVLTQKPLMVRANGPRFLRQGDKATLAATVQNATDQAATADAVLELFDPRSGDIYASRKFNLSLEAMGAQAVTIDWTVPDTLAMVGLRVKAVNGNYGDGEQVMVPVLTTVSPVIETQPFYIEAAQGHFEQPLPAFPADARVTLEYCDNPVWYCVLALPTIWDENYNIATSAAHSLFALQVARGVAHSQPQIKEAIAYWKSHDEDSTLVSMLQKNQDLKIGTLLASPWMREADRQTLRMSRLNELFDDALMAKEYEKIITALQGLQMSDGGFTWFKHPDCKSNVWTTGTVLQLIGEISRLGYLPDDPRLTGMAARAVIYYDSENLRLLNQALKVDKNPYRQFADYAYVRSLFPGVAQSKPSADMLRKVLTAMNNEWSKGLTLKQKAYYAMTLNRNGYAKTARSIVESIRQFAIVKPSLGMYWDNLQTGRGWWEWDKVAYTSTILQAMNEVDARQDEIDQVRKWMLLMKQSNDWGSNSLAADAVYSILTTGSQWLQRAATPSITVAGRDIALGRMAQWLGYCRTTLPATAAGNVVIDRSSDSPAWGAIYSQFKAPMTQIREAAIEEMSISKEYYAYSPDGTLQPATSFKVGDKVKVRLVIKVNKDMDFVTVTDERAACFEPVDQLSGYRGEDATWFYQETKDSQTNLFINSLDKGTHIIGYDVWVTNQGEFTTGIATAQCQYAPQLSAHSSGKTIAVNP